MKKQTKVMATLSTAALLALGFSAVSMAAGWDNSTGAWRYLNNDGTEVTDEWKSANGNWFYLDSDGVMATDKLIEDESGSKTKYYYVDQYGAMVKNTWKAVAMDDDDNTDLDAEYWWYYFGNDGKAYTTDSDKSLSKSKIKTINGLKYAFDSEGHMLYGWTDADNHTQNDDDKQLWADAKYYFSGWNDGHAQTGWAQINVEKEDGDTADYWFYFNGDGEKQANTRKKINGKYYVFAKDGHMVDEWAYQDWDGASNSKIWGAGLTTKSNVASISYVNGDGSERSNTWIWAIPDENWIPSDYDDDTYRWFYAGKNGKLTVSQVKKINGKKYAFDAYGRMQTGFVEVGEHDAYVAQHDADDFTRKTWMEKNLQNVKYFSSDEEKDGAMKTGYQNIDLDDDTYQFYFQSNGSALTKYDSKIKKFTIAGLVLKPTADDDNNYAAVSATKDANDVLIPAADITTRYEDMDEGMYLVNKQGTLMKGKTVKDENDHYFLTDGDGKIDKKAYDKDDYNAKKDKGEWKISD